MVFPMPSPLQRLEEWKWEGKWEAELPPSLSRTSPMPWKPFRVLGTFWIPLGPLSVQDLLLLEFQYVRRYEGGGSVEDIWRMKKALKQGEKQIK